MMNLRWFKRIGIFFIPETVIGWLIVALLMAYAVYLFIDIDSRSHSVSDTLINFIFNVLLLSIGYSIVGYFTSKK